MTSTDRRRFPAIAALAVAGTALAMLFSEVDAHSPDGPHGPEHTHFYLWRTTITVGVLDNSSGDYTNIISGYASVLSLGSISSSKFYYPPFHPPHKHHFDPDNQISVAAVTIVQEGSSKTIRLETTPSLSDVGTVTLWIGHKSYPFSSPSSTGTNFVEWNTDLDWEEDDEVRVALVYERQLPSAPTNVSVTAPPGEEGTLEVSWDEADDGTFPIECYLVEFRHPSGEARDRKQSYPGSLGTGEGCGDSPPTSVKRTDLELGTEYQVLVQALSGDGYGDWSETKTAPGTHGDSSDRSDDSSGQKKQSEEPASAPDKPTGLSATATHDRVVLTWDDPGDDSITGYVILRRVRVNNTGGDFSVLVADTGSAATTYTDATVAASTTYTYRIKAINERGTSERSRWYHIDTPAAPASKPAVADGPPGLAPNAPNPFNANTLIPYRLDADGPVRLEIYNLLGQPVRTLVNQYQDAGFYKVRWDARDRRGALVSAGMYLVRLHYPGGVQTQRLLYLK